MQVSIRKGADLESDSRTVGSAVREIYRPILRGYFGIYSIYYASMLVLNYLSMESGADFLFLQTLTFAATCIAVFCTWHIRQALPARETEIMLFAINAVVVANVFVALSISFIPEKLTYFIIMSVLFALASSSLRQSVVSIALAFSTMSAFVSQLDGATFAAYGFISFAAAISSLSIAFYLRKAISRIAEANIKASDKLSNAQDMSRKLRKESLSDSLTNLPNRRAFFANLNQAMRALGERNKSEQAAPSGSWLILIDLDGFKAVNDIHGHLIGDQLLIAVADRLRAFAREDTHVSRMGGDEFNMVIAGNVSEKDLVARCKQLLTDIAKPYLVDDRQVLISCSVGCIELDHNAASETQISNADYALMAAKKQGKNRLVIFSEAYAEQAGARFKIENALRRANLEKEISVVFQPQFKLGSSEIVGAEVLARWVNPEVGPIAPQRFIQIAEESGLVANITLVVVEKAMRELSSWTKPIPISINLSGHDLLSDPVIDAVIDIVSRYKIAPSLIEFEVTETAMMADIQKAATNLERLSGLGFSIALDDFGTGYSNFNYLRSLPINRLKVDKSFVEDPGDPMAEKVLTSLVGMARVLGVNCLLEGVENEIALVMAKRAGAELVQGYLFGKPMESSELMALISENSAAVEVV